MNNDIAKTKVSICGCGWLGLPLAAHLVSLGYEVWGSRRSLNDAQPLEDKGIRAIELTLPAGLRGNEQLEAFLATDVMVVNIPPGRHSGAAAQFRSNVEELLKSAKLAGCKRVVFVSTTAVYGAVQGQVTEVVQPEPETESAQAHAWLEQYLQDNWQDDAVVLRLGGLIGPDRHPVRYLAGRKGIESGHAKVNLIHLDDCIQAISQIIGHWPAEHVLHLAAPSHPTRVEYYTKMAELAALPFPEFVTGEDKVDDSKWIDASATCRLLGLDLRYPDLMVVEPELANRDGE